MIVKPVNAFLLPDLDVVRFAAFSQHPRFNITNGDQTDPAAEAGSMGAAESGYRENYRQGKWDYSGFHSVTNCFLAFAKNNHWNRPGKGIWINAGGGGFQPQKQNRKFLSLNRGWKAAATNYKGNLMVAATLFAQSIYFLYKKIT
jgi:hypothetical protein